MGHQDKRRADDVANTASNLATAEATAASNLAASEVAAALKDVKKAILAIGFAELTASASSQSFDFAAALPAGAVILGVGIDITTEFDDGSSGVYTADLGISGGDVDAFLDGVDLETAGKVTVPQGVQPTGLVGAITPALIVDAGAVDVDTTIAGALVVTVLYVDSAAL